MIQSGVLAGGASRGGPGGAEPPPGKTCDYYCHSIASPGWWRFGSGAEGGAPKSILACGMPGID
eukprot:12312871-Alexandrium_andersonii.AAC.1